MGKGGALNSWLREFCALVFTQTIQAFIYAIIITLIMATTQFGVEAENNEYRQDQLINTTSMGIINIFALTSIFKIEELARKVFGIQRSSIDPKNPMSSMAKLAFISHFGRRLWDNGKKMVKGVTGGIKSRRVLRKDISKVDKQKGDKVKKHTAIQKEIDELNTQIAAAANGKDPLGGSSVNMNSVSGNTNVNTGTNGSLDVANLNINATNVNMSGGNLSGAQSLDEKKQKLLDKKEALEDAILELDNVRDDKVSAANKQLVDSIHMAMSGAAETAGALLGGAIGAVIGGADGKDAAHGMIVGMNLGDRVGQSAVDAGFSASEAVIDYKKDRKVRQKIADSKENTKIVNSYIDSLKDNIKAREKKVYDEIRAESARLDADTNNILNNM